MTEVTTTGSTMPRRQLGRSLRELRNRARITVRAAAAQLEWSEAKIWRIETGQTALRSLDVEAMCRIYGALPEVTEALMSLAKETKARGWWHSYGDVIPDGFDVYLDLEEAASHLAWYASGLIPGLLQTEDYARTVIRADNPGVPDAGIERRLDVHIARQTLLTRAAHPLVVEVALDEAILHRLVGGEETAHGQLKRLAAASELPTVSLRVIPFTAGLHHGIRSGPFEILRFPLDGNGQETEPPMVYVDGFTADLYLDKPHEVDRYDTAFRKIWESSLDERASRELITQVARELGK